MTINFLHAKNMVNKILESMDGEAAVLIRQKPEEINEIASSILKACEENPAESLQYHTMTIVDAALVAEEIWLKENPLD